MGKAMIRWLRKLFRGRQNRKLEWTELSPSQRQMLLGIKAKHERYRKLQMAKK
jgi:hypothetical protein